MLYMLYVLLRVLVVAKEHQW